MRATASNARLREHAGWLAAGVLAVALIWALSLSRAWDAVEAKVFDLFTTLAAPHASPLPIVVLAVDEPTFQELQVQWPFPRSLHAQLVDRLRADGASAVGFDIVFAEPSAAPEDAALVRAIAGWKGRVVLASTQEMINSANATLWTTVPPLPQLIEAGAVAGDISVRPDDDYVVRRQPEGDESFAARLAALSPVPAASRSRPPELIEYLGPRGTIDTRSYYQAVVPGLLPPGFFRNKIVLVGRSSRNAAELQSSRADTFNSPFAAADQGDRLFPGVEIQATMLANRISGGGLNRVAPGWAVAFVAAFGALIALVSMRAHPGAAAALAAMSAAGVVALSWALFTHGKLWLPPVFPAAALLAFYAVMALLGYFATRRRALRVRGMFSQYVPPAVVERLVEHPELMRLGGDAREVTLMFTDLANFTTLSEQLSAEQTVEMLTGYFNAMTPIIHKYQGTVDKFIGDAIMAFWGAPLADESHAEHAVRAAIEMQAAMQPLVHDLQARGLPAIAMRVGVHTGQAVVGNVGSETRFSYTAIGDAVNLAARLEGANKAFGTCILISGSTAARLPPDILLRPLDDVIVKGKSAPVRVYTPCDDPLLRAHSEQALAAFAQRQWGPASEQLRAVLQLRPADPAAMRLLERVQQAQALPDGEQGWAAVSLDKL